MWSIDSRAKVGGGAATTATAGGGDGNGNGSGKTSGIAAASTSPLSPAANSSSPSSGAGSSPGAGGGPSPSLSRGIDGSTTFIPSDLSPHTPGLGLEQTAQGPGLGPGAVQTPGLPSNDPISLSMEALNRGTMEATKAAKVLHTLSTHPLENPYQHIMSTHYPYPFPLENPYQHILSSHHINTLS